MRTHDVKTFFRADHPESTEQTAQITAPFATKYFPIQLVLLLDSSNDPEMNYGHQILTSLAEKHVFSCANHRDIFWAVHRLSSR